MKRIRHLVKRIDAELHDAEEYAESYIDCRTSGNNQRAAVYRDIASDELSHAERLHEIAAQEIQDIGKYIEAPETMTEKWKSAHHGYVERAAVIKATLDM